MASQYDEKDKAFVNLVAKNLIDRAIINMNENEGVARFGNINETIYPTVYISNEDIKEATNRRSVRAVVKEKFKEEFRNRHFNVTDTANGFKVEYPPEKGDGMTNFPNVRSLLKANKISIAEYEASKDPNESEEEYRDRNPLKPFLE